MFGYIMIEVCDANPASTRVIETFETEYDGVAVMETSCLSECELCASRPYAMLNGDIIFADTVDALIADLRVRVDEILSFYETDT